MTMTRFDARLHAHLIRGVSAAALASGLFLSAPAFAQQQAAPVQAKDDQTVEEEIADTPEIVVSGFRGALETAVAEKKTSDQVVESVSAEDIGKLPDASIGESIARLPGITSQRLNGRSNVISIRGFGPDFSQTLLNGREQTSTNDNRGVEFDQYPAEVVSEVVIYKTPSASLVGQGLVGTVDIRTIRPLDYGRQVLAVGARGSYADLGALNAGSREFGFRANATYVDQFADDQIGVALSAAYTEEPYQIQEFNAWGYFDPDGSGNVVPAGSKSFVTSTLLKRLGFNGTVQARVSDQITLTADGFYSNFNDDQSKRGIELPFSFFGTTFGGGGNVVDGQYTTGTFNNVQGVVRNDIFNRKADLYSGGLNAKYEGDNGWNAFLDFGYSRTDRKELSIESYSGTGYNWNPNGPQTDATDTIGFTSGSSGSVYSHQLDYSDPSLIKLTDPLGWGGDVIQAGYSNDRMIKDELKQFRAEVERELGGDILRSVQLGANYTTRTKSLTPDESFVTLPNGATEVTIPGEFLLEPTNLDYLGLGPVVSYDARDLIAAGVLTLQPNMSNDVPAKAYTIDEDVLTLYAQANIDAPFDGGTLTGNIGIQAQYTDQSSRGIAFLNGTQVDVSGGDKYWEVLPSMNFSARFDSDFVIRVGFSRQIMKPRLDDMRAAISYGLTQTPFGAIIDGNGGNPQLRPYIATGLDLNFERYFGLGGYVAVQLFTKTITSYISNDQIPFDYSNYPLPAGQTPISLTGRLSAPANTGNGSLKGVELAGTLPFGLFVDALDGFGVTGGVGYTDSKVEDVNGNQGQIPGYSDLVANGTAYFEKWGFNARGSVRYRSSFLGDFTGFGGSPTRRQALGETIIDGQIGYDFQDGSALSGLSIYLQGQNLTDERFASATSEDTPLQVIDYQIYGRRFLAGFTYKF